MENINFDNVLNIIKPSKEEEERVKSLSNKLISIINEIAALNNINAESVLVGSVAKNTWLHGKADIDIFMKFPLDMDEGDLKEYGLFLGIECIKKMDGKHELRYASHPYVTGFINGFDVDFVPCYIIQSAEELKSAVDRTILHTEYVKKNLKPEQRNEVLLLKKFMESIHTYGAEFKVGGFSGYLCELLIINYGKFIDVLEAASEKWSPKIIIDTEKYGTQDRFEEPMVAIDPTDKNRNVAAALTLQKISEFIIASRNFLDDPKEDYFFDKQLNIDLNDIKEEFKERKTKTILIKFKPPEVPADALYPQIKKTENSLRGVLEREDFKVFNTDSWTDEKNNVIILLEMETWTLPRVKKNLGPFIWSRNHQERFVSKYGNKSYVEGNRWLAEIERKHKDAEPFIKDILIENKIGLLRFGKHIKKEILKEHQIIDILEFLELSECNKDMLLFFYEYLNKNVYLSR
ncbi:CCA tRNA nucleotidyltransferase [Methanobacterium oryzae]|uniref:CCA tRNA nucleotidyltransferase n=1 Tax=Methanobacterium oryzae TaxID=69540 RepID=UPI003D1F9C11